MYCMTMEGTAMSRFISLIVLAAVISIPLTAGSTIRILPSNPTVDVDGSIEKLEKRIPEGGRFALTVNKGKDVSFYNIQWFKNGERIEGATTQELSYPIAMFDMAGQYTVEMSSPCATVTSKPMDVVVESRQFQVNTEIPSNHGVAGNLDETANTAFTLNECKPNPVTDMATISFVSTATSPVTIKVVNLNGQVVATLVNDVLPAGEHSVSISTREYNMTNALYYYVLSAPGFTDTKPMMLVK